MRPSYDRGDGRVCAFGGTTEGVVPVFTYDAHYPSLLQLLEFFFFFFLINGVAVYKHQLRR